jgi:hypothetical protein
MKTEIPRAKPRVFTTENARCRTRTRNEDFMKLRHMIYNFEPGFIRDYKTNTYAN